MPGAFDPARLTLARRLAGLTKRELARRVNVTPPAITQFETGQTVPRPAVLAQLGLILGYPADYFLHIPLRRSPRVDSRSFFRSVRATRQWERDEAEALAEHVADVVALVAEDLELPALDLPDCGRGEADSTDEIEQAARAVREAWLLPPGPVGHVVRELEAHGVIVSRLGDKVLRVDAFSRWLDDRPLVVLWAAKVDKARSRYDAAHELGHLVMHPDPEPANPQLEKQANRFAAAFLMPADDIAPYLPRRAPRAGDWPDLFAVRRQWGVSIAALFRRALDLGSMSEASFRRAMVRLSERGMRRGEGDDLGAPEKPELLARAVTTLAAHRARGIDEVADRLHFSRPHMQMLASVEPTSAHVPADAPRGRNLRAVQ